MSGVELYSSSHSECPPATGLWVLNAGIITGEGDSRYHWFPDYVCLHILSRGRGAVRTPAGEYALRSGDMFSLWPQVDIEYWKCPEDPWLVHFVHLVGPHAVAFGRECGFDQNNCFVRPERPLEIIQGFTTIFDLLKAGEKVGAYEVQSVLYHLVGCCRNIQLVKNRQAMAFADLVQRARMLIEARLDSGLNVNDLAVSMRVGRTTLFNAFRQALGVSPIDYLTLSRLKKAKKLLLERRYTFAQIAAMSGYQDARYFQKRFRLQEKISVADWLEKQTVYSAFQRAPNDFSDKVNGESREREKGGEKSGDRS